MSCSVVLISLLTTLQFVALLVASSQAFFQRHQFGAHAANLATQPPPPTPPPGSSSTNSGAESFYYLGEETVVAIDGRFTVGFVMVVNLTVTHTNTAVTFDTTTVIVSGTTHQKQNGTASFDISKGLSGHFKVDTGNAVFSGVFRMDPFTHKVAFIGAGSAASSSFQLSGSVSPSEVEEVISVPGTPGVQAGLKLRSTNEFVFAALAGAVPSRTGNTTLRSTPLNRIGLFGLMSP